MLGFAANASNVDVFEPGDGAREAYPLKLRGAEIEWLRRPANHLVVERQIHQQRAMQQFARAAALPASALDFGREIAPSDQAGMLVGIVHSTSRAIPTILVADFSCSQALRPGPVAVDDDERRWPAHGDRQGIRAGTAGRGVPVQRLGR